MKSTYERPVGPAAARRSGRAAVMVLLAATLLIALLVAVGGGSVQAPSSGDRGTVGVSAREAASRDGYPGAASPRAIGRDVPTGPDVLTPEHARTSGYIPEAQVEPLPPQTVVRAPTPTPPPNPTTTRPASRPAPAP